MAYSAGFTPHPKISYAGAAAMGAASEAEYLEISVTERLDPDRVREALDTALPPGLDVIEVVEASRVDGSTRFGAFWRVALPLAGPGLITVAAVTFLTAWGEFVFGLTLATSEEMRPITVVLSGFITQFGTRWNELMAVSTVVAIPIILFFVFLQRYIVGGLTAGAMKE